MIRINLLPFRAAIRIEKVKRQITIYFLTVVLLLAGMGYFFWSMSSELSELKEEEKGEFSEEDNALGYRWRYWVRPVPRPDFQKMIKSMQGQEEDESDEDMGNAALFEGPLKIISEMWGQSLRELHVEVAWGSEEKPRTYELVTHIIDPRTIDQVQGMMQGLGVSG